jgi:hypothetical protein
MDGGFVYGHEGVREYWIRQFKIVKSQVSPLMFYIENDSVRIKVHQVVYNLEGNLLANEMVDHHFYLNDGKISESTSLRFHTLNRIHQCCPDSLYTDCQKSYNKRKQTRNQEYPPAHIYTISKILQPAVHCPGCQWKCNQ